MKAQVTTTPCHERLLLQNHIPLATPLVVYVEPSGYCNLKCSFCPHGADSPNLKKGMMDASLFRKLIDDLGDFPEPIKLLRICGNGDPLMHKEIVELARYARERGHCNKIELVTNGLLLTEQLIHSLPHFLDRIIVSIEGLSAEDYRRTCNANIDFQDLLRKLDALYAQRNQCLIHVKTFDENVRSAEERQCFFDLFGNCCDEIYIEKLVPMWPQLDIARTSEEFRWGGELTQRRVCAQIFKGLQVQADGEVVPCCVDWKRVNVLGNIKETSFIAIWNGDKLRSLQIEHLLGNKVSTEPCKDCTMNDYCEIDNIDLHAEQCLRRLRP